VAKPNLAAAGPTVFSAVAKVAKPYKAVVASHNMPCRVSWNEKQGIWMMYRKKGHDPNFLFFGTQNPADHRSGSLSITCQINLSKGPSGRKRAGLVLSDGKSLYLGHNGGIGGGKQGVGKNAFLTWYRDWIFTTVDVENTTGKATPCIIIGKIAESPKFLSSLERFVFAVERFKKEHGDEVDINDLLQQDAEAAEDEGEFQPGNTDESLERILRSINLRRGQPEFRTKLLKAYSRRCAMCGCDCIEALEAAHIRRYGGYATNYVPNVLLLHSDLHALFDVGKIGVDPSTYTILVAKVIRDTVYGELHGKPLHKSSRSSLEPNKKFFKSTVRSGACDSERV
jgi:hypothetical protein